MKAVIQAYCVPDGTTSFVQAAVEEDVAVVVDAWVPSQYVAATPAVVEVATQIFFQVLAIGGVTDSGGPSPSTNVVPFRALTGAIYQSLFAVQIQVQDVRVQLNGSEANVQLSLTPIPEVAALTGTTVNATAVS